MMAIEFILSKNENYFTWTGSITGSEAINQYKIFFNGSDWIPGMNELCDLSNFDFKSISTQELINMSNYAQSVYERYNLSNIKVAAFSPHDLQFGMASAYRSWSDESPECIKVFRDLDEAKEWLFNKKN